MSSYLHDIGYAEELILFNVFLSSRHGLFQAHMTMTPYRENVIRSSSIHPIRPIDAFQKDPCPNPLASLLFTNANKSLSSAVSAAASSSSPSAASSSSPPASDSSSPPK